MLLVTDTVSSLRQPDHTSTDLFQVIVNGPEYQKWKDGDRCVAESAVG